MEGTKFCPVAKADCRKEQCAWWDKYIEECAVLSMSFALWADVDEDEEDGEEDGEEEIEKIEKIEKIEEEEDNEEDEEFENGEVKEFKVKIKRLE